MLSWLQTHGSPGLGGTELFGAPASTPRMPGPLEQARTCPVPTRSCRPCCCAVATVARVCLSREPGANQGRPSCRAEGARISEAEARGRPGRPARATERSEEAPPALSRGGGVPQPLGETRLLSGWTASGHPFPASSLQGSHVTSQPAPSSCFRSSLLCVACSLLIS